jgi:hypothetical protein
MINFSKKTRLGLALACVLVNLLWPAASQARNTKLLLPVTAVFSQRVVQQAIGGDMSIIFGSAAPAGMAFLSDEIFVRGVARPDYRGLGITDDPTVCKLALQNALVELIQQARAKSANAVVGIVSFYDRVDVMDSPTEYECHAGATRAVVDLKARLGKSDRVYVAAAGTAERTLPPASGFADISDVERVPFQKDTGREAYRLWLTRAAPKAFAVAENGRWAQTWGNPSDPTLPRDAAVRVLQICYEHGGKNCQLYAVDSTVVYRANAAAGQVSQSNLQDAPVLKGE